MTCLRATAYTLTIMNQPGPTLQPLGVDENGVKMIYQQGAKRTSILLKMTDNIEGSKFIYTDNNQATKITEGAVTFQRLKGNPGHYPSMPDGKTVRVNVNAGGFINRQVHTWKDPGVQFIWTPKDSRNAEFTIYYRTTNPYPHTNSVSNT